MPTTPDIDCEQTHPVLAVSDILAAADFNAMKLCEFQRGNGVEVVLPPEDRPYGLRDHGIDYDCHASYRFVER